jgi:hypothetical protein
LADDLQLARVAREAALATEGVRRLGTGRWSEAATYGPGEKVSGVVVEPDEVQVHIVVGYPLNQSIPALAQRYVDELKRMNTRLSDSYAFARG